jgi:pyruvate dehydrogenase E1 component
MLEENYGVAADVWSVTSYKELYSDAIDCERWNLLHPDQKARIPYLRSLLEKEQGGFVAASDYMKVLPAAVAQWFPGPLHCLGTDGFGRSDDRARLRDFFEVDARYIVLAALRQQVAAGHLPKNTLPRAVQDLQIDAEKLNPHHD